MKNLELTSYEQLRELELVMLDKIIFKYLKQHLEEITGLSYVLQTKTEQDDRQGLGEAKFSLF